MPDFKGLSPMLRHALESFEHGVFHYLDGTETSRKFALLHVDHAIELVLKEKVAQTGQSIFKKDGKTIGVHEAYSALAGKGVSIPEKPRLEDLHDFRNIVQHKGLTPDEHTTEFYVTEVYRFMKRFLDEEMGMALGSFLPRPYVMTMEGVEPERVALSEDVARRLDEAERLFSYAAYESAIISAFVALEIAIRGKAEDRTTPLNRLVETMVKSGELDRVTWRKLRAITDLRNRAAHTGDRVSAEQARETLSFARELAEVITA